MKKTMSDGSTYEYESEKEKYARYEKIAAKIYGILAAEEASVTECKNVLKFTMSYIRTNTVLRKGL